MNCFEPWDDMGLEFELAWLGVDCIFLLCSDADWLEVERDNGVLIAGVG